jgi:CheY-like chemotaxis protein
MSIMVVDDNLLMQQVISRFLVSQGHTVVVARSAAEALELARERHYKLFVIDLHLPDQDGPELLTALRSQHGYQNTPAVAVSGLGEMERQDVLRDGFDAYLSKPIDLDELLATVQRHVEIRAERVLGA